MDSVVLGKVVSFVERFGMQEAEIVGGEYHLYTSKLYTHLFIQGTTKSGKTEFLKSLIKQLIDKGIKVCVVDGKGDEKFWQDVCVMAWEKYQRPTPVFKYGVSGESTVFHGFTGDNQSVYNRLVSLLGEEDTGTDADFHKKKRRALLLHVCGVNIQERYPQIAPFEPPRSFQEVASRLTPTEWRSRFHASKEALAVLDANLDWLQQLNEIVWTAATPYIDRLSSDGFKLGDHPVSVFSLGAGKGGFQTEYFMKYIAEAFKDAMGSGNMIWIIDEVGTFGGKNVKDFTMRGRGFGLGLILALQSVASLREGQYIEEILDSTNTKIIMKNDDAEELRRRAGTRISPDRSKNFDQDGRNRGGSVRSREEDKIRQEDVQNLLPGQMFVVNGGSVIKVKSEMVELKTPFHPAMQLLNKKPPQVIPAQQPQRPKNPGPNPF